VTSVLAAYDFGAPPQVLQAIYDEEGKVLDSINLVDRQRGTVAPPDTSINAKNWNEHVGQDKFVVSGICHVYF